MDLCSSPWGDEVWIFTCPKSLLSEWEINALKVIEIEEIEHKFQSLQIYECDKNQRDRWLHYPISSDFWRLQKVIEIEETEHRFQSLQICECDRNQRDRWLHYPISSDFWRLQNVTLVGLKNKIIIEVFFQIQF